MSKVTLQFAHKRPSANDACWYQFQTQRVVKLRDSHGNFHVLSSGSLFSVRRISEYETELTLAEPKGPKVNLPGVYVKGLVKEAVKTAVPANSAIKVNIAASKVHVHALPEQIVTAKSCRSQRKVTIPMKKPHVPSGQQALWPLQQVVTDPKYKQVMQILSDAQPDNDGYAWTLKGSQADVETRMKQVTASLNNMRYVMQEHQDAVKFVNSSGYPTVTLSVSADNRITFTLEDQL